MEAISLSLNPGEWPSDRLLSRLSRALEKRALDVMDLFTVKSLLHQKSSTAPKRRRLADGLYMHDDDEDKQPEGGNDIAAYFQRMRIYFMGLAIVGASPCGQTPASPEELGADSTEYVLVPWDLFLRYQSRAEKTSAATAANGRLATIMKLDLEERGEWTHRFATANKSLGSIIKEVYLEREALWTVATAPHSSRAPPEPVVPPRTVGTTPVASGAKVVSQLRDGTPLMGPSTKAPAASMAGGATRAIIAAAIC